MLIRGEKWLLRLYVAGTGWLPSQAYANLERLCRDHLDGRYSIDVIDLLRNPALAAEHGIVATPMVVREVPVPIRKIVGDLSDVERVRAAMFTS